MNVRHVTFSAALLFASFSVALAQQAAITSDPDTSSPDYKANAATMQTFQLPSHGVMLNALMYVAAGAGPHPVVVLLHGFPGNERNLDLAQTLRRAGYDVLFFDYRGSWGSPGEFSFTHSIEDTESAIAYLRDAGNAKKLRADAKNIILIGHSMGGFMARYVGAHDAGVKAVVLISAAPMGVDQVVPIPAAHRSAALKPLAAGLAAEGMAPLAGCTPEGLAGEVIAHADAWNIAKLAPKLAGRPVLVITSDDGLAGSNEAFVAAMPKGTAQVTTLHLATDHSYSDQRIALQAAILDFLDKQRK